jgi:hypothetical protein
MWGNYREENILLCFFMRCGDFPFRMLEPNGAEKPVSYDSVLFDQREERNV